MGSRIKASPSSLFVCWCEVVGGQDSDQPPWIIQKFPSTYDNQEILKVVPQFVFPCKIEINTVQNFSFVLTALDSTFTFGFCRHSPQSSSAMVILSDLPWDTTFFKVLHHCSELSSSESPDDLWSFLQSFFAVKVPEPGTELAFSYPPHNKVFVAKCPNHLRLPTIPDNRNLMEYINAINTDTMLVVFASLLFERRLIIISKHLHRLSACVQAANALLFPMFWQHIYIPVLPQSMPEYLLAPMPYIIGLPESSLKLANMREIGDVVILNADSSHIASPHDDLSELPHEVVQSLRKRLNQPTQGMGDSIPKAFLRAIVMLIGNYRDAIEMDFNTNQFIFNSDKFIKSRPQHMQEFVKKMLTLQIVNQLIDERIDLINSGDAQSDDFEMELNMYSDRPHKNYQQIMHVFKREGGAIVKTIKSKTNPAVKSAVKTVSKGGKQVKELSQEKYKEIRGKMKLPTNRPTDAPEDLAGDPDLSHRSAPSSPSSSRRISLANSGMTARTYVRFPGNQPLRPSRSGQLRESSVPPSLSFSFKSPESPELIPAPHTIDLVGELEQELSCRLSDPSTSLPQKPSPELFTVNGLQSTLLSNNIVRNRPVVNNSSNDNVRSMVLPPPIPNTRSNTTLGTTRAPKQSSPSREELSVASKAASTSLTSLPDIDFTLDIELPPPITDQLLPVCSTKQENNILSPLSQREVTDQFDQSHKHYFRSPRPYDYLGDEHGVALHYSTLPRGVPSASCSYGSTVNVLSEKSVPSIGSQRKLDGNDPGKDVYQTTLLQVCADKTFKSGHVKRCVGTSHDVVCLYGTAQQFRTRMNLPSDDRMRCALVHKSASLTAYDRKHCSGPDKDDIILPFPKVQEHSTINDSKCTGVMDNNNAKHNSSSTRRTMSPIQYEKHVSTNPVPVRAAHYLDRSVSFAGDRSLSRPAYCGVRSNIAFETKCDSPVPSDSSLPVTEMKYSTLGRIKSVPRYDASEAFSQSLAAFSARGNNSDYFYSILSRSRGGSLAQIDNENLETTSVLTSTQSVYKKTDSVHQLPRFKLGPYRGYSFFGIRRCDTVASYYSGSNSHSGGSSLGPSLSAFNDVMTTSLPAALTTVNALPSSSDSKPFDLIGSSKNSNWPAFSCSTQLKSMAINDRGSLQSDFHNLSHVKSTATFKSSENAPPAVPKRVSSISGQLSSDIGASNIAKHSNKQTLIPFCRSTSLMSSTVSSLKETGSLHVTSVSCKPQSLREITSFSRDSFTLPHPPNLPTLSVSSLLADNSGSGMVLQRRVSNTTHQPQQNVLFEDDDLILLSSPQDEDEFDPLVGKNVPIADSSSKKCSVKSLSARLSAPIPHPPVQSFLHSNKTALPLSTSATSASVLAACYPSYLPSAAASGVTSPVLLEDKLVSDNKNKGIPTEKNGGTVENRNSGQPVGIPVLPPSRLLKQDDLVPKLKLSSGPAGFHPPQLPGLRRRVGNEDQSIMPRGGLASFGYSRSTNPSNVIPSSTMASLPAALQQHLANKLNNDARSSSSAVPLPSKPMNLSVPDVTPVTLANDDSSRKSSILDGDLSEYRPFASLQMTTTVPLTWQANPMYNFHEPSLPDPASRTNGSVLKPNLAAEFASSLIDPVAPDAFVNNNNNNNTLEEKMLGRDFSQSFAQMKLNKLSETSMLSTDIVKSHSSVSNNWTSFE